MFWVEWLVGLFLGLVVSRTRVFSIFSVLVVLPFLPLDVHWELIIGLSSSLIVASLGGVSFFRSWDGISGLGLGLVGLMGVPFFLSLFDSFSFLIFPLTLGGLVLLLVFSSSRLSLLVGMVLCLGVGFLVLQRWVVPLGLPALLMGLSSFHPHGVGAPLSESSGWSSLRDAGVGVLTGFLPGVGPGLIGLFKEGSFAPSLGISNLVFSMGLVSLLGNVRSAPAAALSGVFLPPWGVLLFWLALSVVVGSMMDYFLLGEWVFPLWVGVGVHVSLLVFLGGWLGVGAGLLGVCLARVFTSLRVSPALGICVILPSLWIFYG